MPPVGSDPDITLLGLHSIPASYRDRLMADTTLPAFTDDEDIGEDDIEIFESDVKRGMIDELLLIDFSDRVYNLAVKSLSQTIVVKLLGQRIGYNVLRNRIYDLWKPTQGPWLVYGHYLKVEPWTKDFSTTQRHPSKVITWIRLPGLSGTLYKRNIITEIGECIGPLVEYESLSAVYFKCDIYGHASNSFTKVSVSTPQDTTMDTIESHTPAAEMEPSYGS
ncbi:uncharacterized protein LOC120182638 [Hibiscus syriacus]|uniref:uncharacterized protein LOC120182638 n=1 Tax=Hibiscus syriacus TaxID=106335 RepID=UPI0019234C22|nr:uncharacterized protein LOC120182638 [Hibiscus syriacus]